MTGWAIVLMCALGAGETDWRSSAPQAGNRRAPVAQETPVAQENRVRPVSATSPFAVSSDPVDELVDRAGRAIQGAAQGVGQRVNASGGIGNVLRNARDSVQDQLEDGGRWVDDALSGDVNGDLDAPISGQSRFGRTDASRADAGRAGQGRSSAVAGSQFSDGSSYWSDFADSLNVPLRSLPATTRTGTSLVERIRMADAVNEAPVPPLTRGNRDRTTNSVSTSTRATNANLPSNSRFAADNSRVATSGGSRGYRDVPPQGSDLSSWLDGEDSAVELEEDPLDDRLDDRRFVSEDPETDQDQYEYDRGRNVRSSANSRVATNTTTRSAARREMPPLDESLSDDEIVSRMQQNRRRTLEQSGVASRSTRDAEDWGVDDPRTTRLAANQSTPNRRYVPELGNVNDADPRGPLLETSSGTRAGSQLPPEQDSAEFRDEDNVPSASDGLSKALANRPWWPLTLAVVALFASVGFNFYLGWIAWDLYTRYQDAIADVQELEARIENQQFEQSPSLENVSSRRPARAF